MDADLAEQGGNIQYGCTLNSNNGRHFHVLDNKAIFHRSDGSRGGIVGVLVDITDLKKIEEALRASEEKFLKAFHSSPTLMLIITADEGGIIEANKSFLQHMSFTHAEKAIEILARESIMVMFLDLNLPGMSGIDLCRKIRKENQIAVINALTGFSNIYGLLECRGAGFDDFFIKPITLKALFKAAEDAFDKIERWQVFEYGLL